MKHLRAYIYIIGIVLVMGVTAACSVSYKFNGASINYTTTKTIQLADFPIRSSYVWGPMGPMFNNELKDKFASNTQSCCADTGDLQKAAARDLFHNSVLLFSWAEAFFVQLLLPNRLIDEKSDVVGL